MMRGLPHGVLGMLGSVAACLIPLSAQEQRPHVAGYERFHRSAPNYEGGAILFSELGCANCHGGGDVVIPRRGPNLIGLPQRVNHAWLQTFLADPSRGRKGSTMPALFAGFESDHDRERAIDDVLAWLGSLKSRSKIAPQRHANAERGSALFHEMGCAACHPSAANGHETADGSGFADHLPNLRIKTNVAALTHLLNFASTYRPDGRMPHVPLESQDAPDIAAFLLDFRSSDPSEDAPIRPWPKTSDEAIRRGRKIAESLNCAACHDLPGVETTTHPLPASLDSESGCFSRVPIAERPFYRLGADQIASLNDYLKSQRSEKDPAVSLVALNCLACHTFNKVGGPNAVTERYFVGDSNLGDAGRFPPPLTGIGGKLKSKWLREVFQGKAERVRPYLQTRMPIYPDHAEQLTGGCKNRILLTRPLSPVFLGP